jgi:hypothetical protein
MKANRVVPKNKTDWNTRLRAVSRYITELENETGREWDRNWRGQMGAVSRYVMELESCLDEARGIIAKQRYEMERLVPAKGAGHE